jgi:hypothetical protein
MDYGCGLSGRQLLSKHKALLSILRTALKNRQVQVAYTYHPSYSGDGDQENHGLKSVYANNLRDPLSKKKSQKGQVEWLKC